MEGSFKAIDKYFIWKDGTYHQVRSKGSVLRVLKDEKKQLNRFAMQQPAAIPKWPRRSYTQVSSALRHASQQYFKLILPNPKSAEQSPADHSILWPTFTDSYCCFILFFVAPVLSSSAQQVGEPLVSASYRNVPFQSFIQDLEAKVPYTFYYDPAQTDSITVDIQVAAKPLSEVLKQALAGTDLQFAISAQRQVFITKERAILTQLPLGYFDNEKDSRANQYSEGSEPFLRRQETQKKAASEIKLYEIGTKGSAKSDKVNLAGTLRDARTGEPIIGAYVYIESPTIGTASDQYGYYSLTLAGWSPRTEAAWCRLERMPSVRYAGTGRWKTGHRARRGCTFAERSAGGSRERS
jgi:hypothetical protein